MSSCWTHSRAQHDLPGPGQCGVCGWRVERGRSWSSVLTSCCNNKHHRDCIQVLASLGISSCPSCHCGESYKEEMTVNGIYFSSPHQVSPVSPQSFSPGVKLEDFSTGDSGISISSPLISSTPLYSNQERDRNKRKSLTDMTSCGKRTKSFQGDEDLATSIVQLKPRKIEESDLETDQEDDSIVIIDSDSDSEYFSSRETEFHNSEEEIEMSPSSPSTSIEDLTGDSDSCVDNSLEDSFESCDESELDLEDIKALEEETSSDPVTENPENSEVAEDTPAISTKPTREKNVSASDLLQRQRKKMLMKIKKKPLRERLVLHGRHPAFLPWNQEVYTWFTLPL